MSRYDQKQILDLKMRQYRDLKQSDGQSPAEPQDLQREFYRQQLEQQQLLQRQRRQTEPQSLPLKPPRREPQSDIQRFKRENRAQQLDFDIKQRF
jgi:hypothetical protein